MKKAFYSLLYYILFALCYLLSLLPLRALYVLSDVVYFLVYHIARYRRKIVRKNLTGSFPEKSRKGIIRIEKKFYSMLCDYFFEAIKLASMSKEEVMKRMRFEGLDQVHQLTKQGKSAVFYLSHTFNWEWISSLPLHFPAGDNTVLGQVYHILQNQAFDRLFLRLRGRFGAVSISMVVTLRKMLEYKRDNIPFVMGFIADQVPMYQASNHWLNFLNHPDTPVITGAEKLAKGMNCAVFYTSVVSPRRGYYTCRVSLMAEETPSIPDYQLTDMYFARLENDIRTNPSSWLWTHNRWKRTKEGFRIYEERQKKQRS